MSHRTTSWIYTRCLCRALRWHILRFNFRQQHYSIARTVDQKDGISPVLISRARELAKEHSRLESELSDSFDSSTAKKAGELGPVASALNEWDKARDSINELQTLMKDSTTDAELRELAADDMESAVQDLKRASASLTLSLVPKHPFEQLPCLLEIRPGNGGDEAALFAMDMLRMYQAYCSANGLRTTLVKFDTAEGSADPNGSASPLQVAILEVTDEGAYGRFRSEAGVHRVQRVPATETKGRTHTSSAAVLVLPSFPDATNGGSASDFEDPTSDYYVDPREVRVDIMRARGAGGQHVNTTESAVRLVHIPTGITVSMQDYRSQPKNKEAAWKLIRSRVAQGRREIREAEIMQTRRDIVGVRKMGRENKIRTYNYGQQRVTDHRSGLTLHDLDDVIAGGQALEKVMESVRQWLVDGEIQALAAENPPNAKGQSHI
ncbi:release factor [Pseudovirgaria hyperparasitica]|uniref:Release factor n=1 Tax=Pseudovirgaria hyperparasitica TaxID=470096 RepID=A0A6A6W6M4_9PEZI|nr:release factor [Pseudovirgaria hyperparasitica]KAF2758538.1 release factor [Pseudovirgaria hyperparasitica]